MNNRRTPKGKPMNINWVIAKKISPSSAQSVRRKLVIALCNKKLQSVERLLIFAQHLTPKVSDKEKKGPAVFDATPLIANGATALIPTRLFSMESISTQRGTWVANLFGKRAKGKRGTAERQRHILDG